MTRQLERERTRLRRAFSAALFAIVPVAAVEACDDSVLLSPVDSGADVSDSALADEDALANTDAQITDRITGIDTACSTLGDIDAAPDAAPDADPGCWYTLPCGLPPKTAVLGCEIFIQNDDGGLEPFGCHITEHKGCESDVYVPGPNGATTIDCKDCLGGSGRRTAGTMRARSGTARSRTGAWLARVAHDEAASVIAFARMEEELVRLRAPGALVRGARRSAKDEIRHARTMTRLARAHGASPCAPRIRRSRGERSLETVARENAVEGCVNETFGALLLAFQAEHAIDPAMQTAFRRIAKDELRHAALAWTIARWAEKQLDPRARARVTRASARALDALEAKIASREASTLDLAIGYPDRDRARGLVKAIRDYVHSAQA